VKAAAANVQAKHVQLTEQVKRENEVHEKEFREEMA